MKKCGHRTYEMAYVGESLEELARSILCVRQLKDDQRRDDIFAGTLENPSQDFLSSRAAAEMSCRVFMLDVRPPTDAKTSKCWRPNAAIERNSQGN